jgi:tetratricopeptide (TPR) repeat protein
LALYAGLLGGIYAAAREYVTKGRFQMLLAIGWILITFLPASNLFFTVGTVVGERLLFIPSVGWAAIVPYLVANASPSGRSGRWLCAGGLLVFYIWNSGHRTWMWRSRVTLFGGDARNFTRSAKTLHQFATTLHRTGHLEEARGLYEASLAVFDDNALTDYCIAQIDLERNKFESAYDRFVKIANGHGIGFGGFNRFLLLVDFGFACVALGRHDQAVPLLEEGLGLNLDVPHGLNALAVAYAHLGQPNKAIDSLTTGLKYDPTNVWLFNNLAAMALIVGNLELAVGAVNRAIELCSDTFGAIHTKIARNAEIVQTLLKGESVTGSPEIELFFHRMI